MKHPPALTLYRAGAAALAPLAPLWLGWRARQGKEDSARLAERYGRNAALRPEGRLVWLHGASVGELGVLLQIQEALAARDPSLFFLVTTGTRTSAALFERRAPARTLHAFAPLDAPGAVARFLAHWRPDLGVLAESELWPNLILEARARAAPLALVNARLSPKTLARWDRQKQSARVLLDAFALLLAAEPRTADALSALSGRAVETVGNLKFAAPAPPIDPVARVALRAEIGARPVWLAASTHEGEEAILIDAHTRLIAERPDALLVLAPRHPERGAKVAALAGDAPRRALRQAIGQASVYVADTLGELGLFYATAQASFVGGSLLPTLAGHNPIEPAKLGSAILSGPYVESFADAYDALHEAGGALSVTNSSEIAAAVSLLWNDANARERLVKAAARAVDRGGDALTRTASALATLLDTPARAPANAPT